MIRVRSPLAAAAVSAAVTAGLGRRRGRVALLALLVPRPEVLLEHRVSTVEQAGVLSGEQRELLRLVAAGLPLGEAARRLNLSRRTADRRLSAARRALGVGTTTEAVLAVVRRPS